MEDTVEESRLVCEQQQTKKLMWLSTHQGDDSPQANTIGGYLGNPSILPCEMTRG